MFSIGEIYIETQLSGSSSGSSRKARKQKAHRVARFKPVGQCCVFNLIPKSLLQKTSENDRRVRMDLRNIPNDTINHWSTFEKNDLIIEDPDKLANTTYPKHQKAGGKQYGLTVLANPVLREYSTCTANDGWGFKIVAHSPISSPNIMDYGTGIPINTEAFVDMDAEVTVDQDVSNIPLKKRGCYLPLEDEESNLASYNYYSAENCFMECLANHTWSICSCVQFFMPRNDSQKLCGAKKRKCAEEVHANLTKKTGKQNACSRCLPPCEEIQYRMQVSHFDIREHEATSYVTYNSSDGKLENATDFSIIHIYMGTDSLYAKERKKLYGARELIASAGGLISLTLGVSILSFLELVYLFTIRAYFRFRGSTKNLKDKKDEQNEVFNVRKPVQQVRGRRISTTTKVDGYYNWALRNRFTVSPASAEYPNAFTVGKSSFMF